MARAACKAGSERTLTLEAVRPATASRTVVDRALPGGRDCPTTLRRRPTTAPASTIAELDAPAHATSPARPGTSRRLLRRGPAWSRSLDPIGRHRQHCATRALRRRSGSGPERQRPPRARRPTTSAAWPVHPTAEAPTAWSSTLDLRPARTAWPRPLETRARARRASTAPARCGRPAPGVAPGRPRRRRRRGSHHPRARCRTASSVTLHLRSSWAVACPRPWPRSLVEQDRDLRLPPRPPRARRPSATSVDQRRRGHASRAPRRARSPTQPQLETRRDRDGGPGATTGEPATASTDRQRSRSAHYRATIVHGDQLVALDHARRRGRTTLHLRRRRAAAHQDRRRRRQPAADGVHLLRATVAVASPSAAPGLEHDRRYDAGRPASSERSRPTACAGARCRTITIALVRGRRRSGTGRDRSPASPSRRLTLLRDAGRSRPAQHPDARRRSAAVELRDLGTPTTRSGRLRRGHADPWR
jgi:hypothetical protein